MEKASNQQVIDILSLVKPYLLKWYWFIISIVCCLLIGILYIKTSIPVYNIKSSVLIKDTKKSLGGVSEFGMLEGLSGFGGMSTNSIENELEVFKTKKLSRDVVSINNLQTAIFSLSGLRKVELFGDTSPFKILIINEKKNKKFPKKSFVINTINSKTILESEEFGIKKNVQFGRSISLPFANIIIEKNKNFDNEKAGEIGTSFEVYFSTLESATSAINNMLQIDLADKDATVINISMNYPQTDKAKLIIRSLIDAYNKDAILDKNSESQKTKEFIEERINKISKELGIVESEKEQFKTANKITDILTETRVNLELSSEAKKKQLELTSQLDLTNDLIAYVRKQSDFQVLPSNIGLDNSESNNVIGAYNKMIMERDRLLENATSQNPLVVEVTQKINSLKKSLQESLLKNKTGLQLALDEYQGEQNKIDSRITKVPLQEKLFRSLERQQQIKENLYLVLLQKREETAISLAVVAPKARIVEPPVIGDKPVSPKKMIILLGCLVIGALVPFVFIYLKQFLNNKIIDKNDLKTLSSIPVLAEIPSIKKNIDHLVKQNDFSQLAESFRILITNMGFMLDSGLKSKVIYVTSSIKGEGKTFVSMNLALTLSNFSKIIIIGADIRNPQLQRYQNRKKSEIGLSEFLYDSSIQPQDVIFKNPVSDASDIIYSGNIPPNPTELLKNGRLGVLLDFLKTEYEYIIIDTAPLLLVTDTLTISNYADLKLYVTRSNYTGKSLIEFANELVDTGKLDNVAFVLNDVENQNFGYGNKYGYGYNNK